MRHLKQIGALSLLWLVIACGGPIEQDYRPAVQRPIISDDSYQAVDSHVLPMRQFVPSKRTPTALLVALHGFNDYSNAFAEAGTYFKQYGIATYAYDQRGFGDTDQRGIWASKANLVRDTQQLIHALHEEHPDVPIYLLGDSMGAAVALNSCANHQCPHVEGLILVAPALWGEDTLNGFYRFSLWLAVNLFPSTTVTGQGLNVIPSDNIAMLRRLGQDPLILKETRVDALHGIVQLMDAAYRNIGDVHTPMLFLYGAKDEIIPHKPIRKALKLVNAPYSVAYYPDGYHMLLRDLQGETVLRDIAHWILAGHQGHLPSGFDEDWENRLWDE